MRKEMKTLKYMVLCCVVFSAYTVSAQHARFIESGVVIYEKRVNMYAKIKSRVRDGDNFMQEAYEQYRKTRPQFNEYEYTLAFNTNKTLYNPSGKKQGTSMGFFGNDPSIDMGNIVYTDLGIQQSTSQKSVYEQTFLVADSVRHISWKITDEFREIAGYNCRRANAIVLDSIYVVAFYTDQIPVTGGPESFAGLPGMILGLALPHENTTWFAKTVEDKPVPANEIVSPKKGRAVDREGLKTTVQSSLKNWGEYANPILKALML